MNASRYHGVDAHIGHTPLIRLRRLSELTGCEILGKAEFMNPGGSVKDRAGLAIIADAEQRGVLGPGGTVVEGTAGNTGIGLTLVGNARGYRTIIVMPETQSILRLKGTGNFQVVIVAYNKGTKINDVVITEDATDGSASTYVSAATNLNITPSPEPGSLVLFGTGLIGFAGLLRRKYMVSR